MINVKNLRYQEFLLSNPPPGLDFVIANQSIRINSIIQINDCINNDDNFHLI